MKRNILATMAVTACVVFTVFMVLSLILAYAFAGPSEGLNITLGLLGIAALTTLLQGIWFTELVFKRLRYGLRLTGFFALLAPLLFGIGWTLGWFPHEVGSVVIFFVIFAVIGGAFAAGYGIYFKVTAGSYEKALDEYRRTKKTEKSS